MNFWDVLKIILYGIIEGVTEWLPVSSTGHLILFDKFLPLPFSSAFMDMFEYVIQLFAIFAVVLYFWKRLFPVEKYTLPENGKNKLRLKKEVLALWAKVLVACIPALVAFFVDTLFLKNLDDVTQSLMIACALIVYGVAFLFIENANAKKQARVHETSGLTLKTAFFIGCFQVLAVIPGTSRSGITIIGALLLGVSRTVSAEFTFFLAVPTMVGASGYKILDFFLSGNTLVGTEIIALFIGCAVAFAVSMFAVKFLMNFVKKHDFKIFGWYRIALGVIVLGALVLPALLA
ncbi:MAG: undecaprenyl-diphosphate phosphatase [Clostridiales bacterium]|nr:undecaprenyl-diphosphate phosphatase [Clostridiales bacterium]